MSVGEVGGQVISKPVERSHRRGMSIIEAVRVALQGLASNKLRSLLTMLGIIIGVGSVISMMAIGQGANEAAQASLRSMGTNVLSLFTGQQVGAGPRLSRRAGTARPQGAGEALGQVDNVHERKWRSQNVSTGKKIRPKE